MGCAGKSNPQPVKAPSFVLPEIPAVLTEPKERANYLLNHYWDNFDFKDTTYIHLPEITEQAFVNYIDLLPHADKQMAAASIQNLMRQAEKEPTGTMLRYFLTKAESYLRDPNSPMRNEEFYIPVTQYITSSDSPLLTLAEKAPAEHRLKMMLKNRVGEKAADFSYTLPSGKTGRMYAINSEYTLLLFYNPDCHACAETISILAASEMLQSLQKSGRLKILAFYPDKDLEIWKKKWADIPAEWINACDKNAVVTDQQLYDLKAIPTIYLLDRNKTVILKDADLKQTLLPGNFGL
jgi:thiol-disulfide isomerase/thioredoxin